MTLKRGFAVLAATLLVLVAGPAAALAQTPTTTPATTEPPAETPPPTQATIVTNPASVEVDFGHDWGLETRTVLVTLSQAFEGDVAAGLVVLPTRSDKKKTIPNWMVSVENAETGYPNERLLTISVNLNAKPPQGTEPVELRAGIYEGIVRLRAGDATATLPLKLTVQSRGPVRAWMILFGGLIVGWLFKWWSDTGKRMAVVVRRQQAIERRLRGLVMDLPPAFRVKRDTLREKVDAFDADGAEQLLTELEGELEETAALARIVDELRDQIQKQRGYLDEDWNRTRGEIPGLELDLIEEALRISDATKRKEAIASAESIIDDVDRVLRKQGETPSPALYQESRVAKKLAAALGSKVTLRARATPLPKPGDLVSGTRGTQAKDAWWQKAGKAVGAFLTWPFKGGRQRLLTQVLPALIGLGTFAILAFAGLDSQYYKDLSFGDGDFVDWFALFLWGFAAVATGKTITDFFGQVSTGMSGRSGVTTGG